MFTLRRRASSGVVGFTTEATPSLLFPGRSGRSRCEPVVPARPGRGRPRCAAKDVDAIIAIGHEGATAGTLTRPDRPARRHRRRARRRRRRHGRPQRPAGDLERANGVLVTENRGKGIRFTRVRMLVRHERQAGRLQDGRLPQAVEHRRHARPGDPGADQRAQRRQLGPIFSTQIGELDRGRPARRTRAGAPTGGCASRSIGNIVTDAMRTDVRRPTSRSRTRAASGPT